MKLEIPNCPNLWMAFENGKLPKGFSGHFMPLKTGTGYEHLWCTCIYVIIYIYTISLYIYIYMCILYIYIYDYICIYMICMYLSSNMMFMHFPCSDTQGWHWVLWLRCFFFFQESPPQEEPVALNSVGPVGPALEKNRAGIYPACFSRRVSVVVNSF